MKRKTPHPRNLPEILLPERLAVKEKVPEPLVRPIRLRGRIGDIGSQLPHRLQHVPVCSWLLSDGAHHCLGGYDRCILGDPNKVVFSIELDL